MKRSWKGKGRWKNGIKNGIKSPEIAPLRVISMYVGEKIVGRGEKYDRNTHCIMYTPVFYLNENWFHQKESYKKFPEKIQYCANELIDNEWCWCLANGKKSRNISKLCIHSLVYVCVITKWWEILSLYSSLMKLFILITFRILGSDSAKEKKSDPDPAPNPALIRNEKKYLYLR